MISLDRRGRVAVLTMGRAPVNAFDATFLDAFAAALDAVEAEETAVLHLRSSQKAFSAGADIKMMRTTFAAPDCGERMLVHVTAMQALFDRIEASPFVTVAEIATSALGGGFELALATDLRVAAHGAKLGLPEARIGLLPGAGGTQRLTRLVGEGIAKRIILGCDMVDGTTAERLGLVQWSVPDAELADFTAALVARIADLSVDALAASKRCIAATRSSIAPGLAIERLETRRLFDVEATRARVRAFLGDK